MLVGNVHIWWSEAVWHLQWSQCVGSSAVSSCAQCACAESLRAVVIFYQPSDSNAGLCHLHYVLRHRWWWFLCQPGNFFRFTLYKYWLASRSFLKIFSPKFVKYCLRSSAWSQTSWILVRH